MTTAGRDPEVEWLVSIRDLDAPLVLRRGRLAAEYLALWAQHIGPVRHHEDADPEDFWEQAARLHAAVHGFGARNVWVTTYDTRRGPASARHLTTGEAAPVENLAHLHRYGSQHVATMHHSLDHGMPQAEIAAGHYITDRAFLDNAGRVAVPSGLHAEGCPDLWDVMAGLAATGPTRVVVKSSSVKEGLWFLDVPGGASAKEISRIDDDLGWDTVRREEYPNAYLVQQWVPMHCEYRLFVVDHQVIGGAGCVEQHTPLDNAEPFDPAVLMNRSDGSSLRRSRGAVKWLAQFGQRVADQARAERPGVSNYTLDVAYGADCLPLVIERNGLLNSGLYASRPLDVTRALARQAASR